MTLLVALFHLGLSASLYLFRGPIIERKAQVLLIALMKAQYILQYQQGFSYVMESQQCAGLRTNQSLISMCWNRLLRWGLIVAHCWSYIGHVHSKYKVQRTVNLGTKPERYWLHPWLSYCDMSKRTRPGSQICVVLIMFWCLFHV